MKQKYWNIRPAARRTKVRTRVVAKAIREMLDTCGTIIVMGHRYSDLDSLGSGLALVHTLRLHGKDAYVAVNRKTTLAPELLRRYDAEGLSDLMLDEAAAKQRVDEKTLLIVTDTHCPSLLEFESLYRSIQNVVVIDHHLKMVDHIDNAAVFYHEPSASSASEMVTELLPYLIDGCRPEKLDAEALLAGIVLDTRNFVMRAGVRTFEAAAYLCRLGAETLSVKQLSSATMEQYYIKSGVITNAKPYKNTVIAPCGEEGSPAVRVAVAQAADELLSVKDCDASFALFADGDTVHISARSYGRFNVQSIMEALGGGGHMTMAATQIPQTTVDDAVLRLKEEIDRRAADV